MADSRKPTAPPDCEFPDTLRQAASGTLGTDPIEHAVQRALSLADQAADLLFEVLPVDGSGLTTLFGVPSAEQKHRAESVARDLTRYADEAELEIELAILAIESAPEYQRDVVLQQRRRRLADTQRDRRIPFLRGVGACLRAELIAEDPQSRRTSFETAAALLGSLDGKLAGGLAAEASLYRAVALAGLEELDAAQGLFETVAADPASPPGSVLAARLGLVEIRSTRDGPEAGLRLLEEIEQQNGAGDLLVAMLIADQRFLLRRQVASSATGNRRDHLMTEAYESYLEILDADLGLSTDDALTVVLAKLVSATDDDTPLDRLPPMVTVARAEQLTQDEGSRAEGIGMVEAALARDDLAARERAAALWGLARALYASEQAVAAAERFIELARDLPAAPEAQRAIEAGVSIAADLYSEVPQQAAARRLLNEGLDLLLRQYTTLATFDQWRYLAGQVALREGRFREALDHFDQIAPDSERRLDAQFMRADAMRRWMRASTDPRERRRLAGEALDTIDRVRPGIEASGPAGERAAAHREYLARLSIFASEALIERGEPERAIEKLEELEAHPVPDQAVVAEALRVRIGAYQLAGRPDEARRALEHFIGTSTAAGSMVGPVLAAIEADVVDLIERNRPADALTLAEQQLVPLAELVEQWLSEHRVDRRDEVRLRRRIAEAYRLGERFRDGLGHYDHLLRDHSNAVSLLFGRAECLYGLGDARLAEAMAIYKRIAAVGGAEAGRYYWQSQLRMLEILDRVGRNTEQIVPRINRLRRQDPELGGPHLRRAFDTLESKYS
jgi:tetratricopeptide (TPR) repeat protein